MVVPSTADGFRAVVSALRSLDGKDGEFSHLHAPRGPMCATPGKEPRQGYAGERGQGGAGIPEHLCSGSHSAAIWPSRSRPLQVPPSQPPLHCVSGARTRGAQGALNHRTLRPASVGGIVPGTQGSAAMQALPTLRPHAAQMRLRTSMHRLWGLPPLQWLLYPAGPDCVLWLRGEPHSELPWLC